jgi:two-component system cell cycle response regulator
VPSVLLVEDNLNDARLIQQDLNGSSFQLDLTRDGEEALARAERNKIDLILLDILLPGMDGIEVCRLLKERDQTRNIQIAMISCLSDLESKIKSLDMGADDFLVKPINPLELKARINALLRKKAYLDTLKESYETALQVAITDKLTRLYNRAYFKYFLEMEIKRSLRQKYPLALIMIEIDDFKQCNDSLGHLAGDRILQEISQLIKSNFREVDCAARFGGEEFAIVLPYCDGLGAAKSAESFRQVIHSHSFLQETAGASKHLTISLGVAEFVGAGTTVEELIQRADEALYRAKKEGKNRVCIHDGHLKTP